ncbi:MAG: histidine kinase [Pseudomonadota bacterium]
MFNWYRNNPLGAVGVLACLIFGGIELMSLLAGGVQLSDLNAPSGMLARFLASMLTPPPSLVRAGSARVELTNQLVIVAQALGALLFTLLLWLRTGIRRPGRLAYAIQAIQALLAAASLSALLYVLAAQLAATLPLQQGRRWLAAQIVLLAAVYVQMLLFHQVALGDGPVRLIMIYAGIGMLFQMLVFGMVRLALGEREARTTLARSHAALLATQAMLADTVRAGERTRIARDLHDAVGHHLSALNLHLDLALRQIAPQVPEALHTSRELARALLSEVRVVVNSERNAQHINLRAAIATMCAGIPQPAIHFDYDDTLEIASPALAHTVFSCVQEALTNVIRHASAALVTIAIRDDDEQLILTVQDDGCGPRGAAEGNGLRGMRERVAEQCGTLEFTGGAGFGFTIALPLAGSYA